MTRFAEFELVERASLARGLAVLLRELFGGEPMDEVEQLREAVRVCDLLNELGEDVDHSVDSWLVAKIRWRLANLEEGERGGAEAE